jgi:hypothetical protein
MKKIFFITLCTIFFALNVYPQIPITMPAYIQSGATNSDTLDLGYMKLLSITFPATFTGATVTVYHSNYLDSAFVPVADIDGIALAVIALDGYTMPVKPLNTYFYRRYIYIKSNLAEAAQRLLKVDKGVL